MMLARSLLAALLFLTACLDDSPVGLSRDQSRIALSVQGTSLDGAELSIRILWPDERAANGQLTLAETRLPVEKESVQVPLIVDLRPCLPSDRIRDVWCDVWIEVTLWHLDAQLTVTEAGPVRLVPGGTSQVPRIYVAQGDTPPVLLSVERAVRVDPGLLRVALSAMDPDGDLIGVRAVLVTADQITVGESSARLPAPQASFTGAIYLPVPMNQEFASVRLFVSDTRGNPSGELGWTPEAIDVELAPVVSNISGSASASDVTVAFDVNDPQEDAEKVDLVFRNVVDGEIVVADTVYGTCQRAILPGNGRKTIKCPLMPGAERATLVVVPFDKMGNWGRADRCTLSPSFSCVGT